MSCNVAAAHLSNLYGLVTRFGVFFFRDVGVFSTVVRLCFASDFSVGVAAKFLAVRAVAFHERFSCRHGSEVSHRSRGRVCERFSCQRGSASSYRLRSRVLRETLLSA